MKPLCSSLLWRIHFLPLCWTARERREPAGFSQSGCLLLPSQLVACNSPTSGPWFKGLSVTVVCLSLCLVGIQPASSFFLRWLHLLFHTTSFSLIFPVGMTLGCVIDGCSRAVEEQVCLNMALRSPSGVLVGASWTSFFSCKRKNATQAPWGLSEPSVTYWQWCCTQHEISNMLTILARSNI